MLDETVREREERLDTVNRQPLPATIESIYGIPGGLRMATVKRSGYVPKAKKTLHNPSAEELQQLTSEMPNARRTEFGNYNVETRAVARSASNTYIATDHPERYSSQCVPKDEARRLGDMQDDYIRDQEMLIIDGAIGNHGALVTPARLIIEKSNANIAGMQRMLYYPAGSSAPEPEVTIIYTPNLPVTGYANERAIIVDLDAGITRVMNSDYFGESKKGGLRMWNQKVYDLGGLPLHAGCKVVPTARGDRVMLIVGLSGTGKTTTTFTVQNGSLPVQDDFAALLPNGRIVATEDGCFAKTFGLDPRNEPAIHAAVIRPTSYLENVSQRKVDGPVDFHDDSYTQNGRAVFGLSDLGAFRDANDIGALDALLILNRNENIVPAVARLTGAQAAAYFMLGETQGTSAGGKDEMGKFLRIPGTNPFFPPLHEMQGNRFMELLDRLSFEVFVLNTGRVGGPAEDQRSKNVAIPHTSAVVKGIAEGNIAWVRDPDFGYDVAEGIQDFDDQELLRPRLLYQRQGRLGEYEQIVRRFKEERADELRKYPGLNPDILAAVG